MYLFPFFIILRLIRHGEFADLEGSTETLEIQAVLSMGFFQGLLFSSLLDNGLGVLSLNHMTCSK